MTQVKIEYFSPRQQMVSLSSTQLLVFTPDLSFLSSEDRRKVLKFSATEEDRRSCSPFCRLKILTGGYSSNRKFYRLHPSRLGYCRSGCQHLLTTVDLKLFNFKLEQRIGLGAQSEVYQVSHPATGRTSLALKILKCADQKEQTFVRTKYEYLIRQLQQKDSTNSLISLIGLVELDSDSQTKTPDVGILMPKFDLTLDTYATQCQYQLSRDDHYNITYSVLQALDFLHGLDPKILHRDLKPSNIFGLQCSTQGQKTWVLGDFSISRSLTDQQTHYTGGTGTFFNLSPEQIFRYEYYPVSDLWGLGVTLYWLLSGQSRPKALHAYSQQPNFLSQIKADLENNQNSNSDYFLISLVQQMLQPDHKRRPTAQQALDQITEVLHDPMSSIQLPCKCNVPHARAYFDFES